MLGLWNHNFVSASAFLSSGGFKVNTVQKQTSKMVTRIRPVYGIAITLLESNMPTIGGHTIPPNGAPATNLLVVECLAHVVAELGELVRRDRAAAAALQTGRAALLRRERACGERQGDPGHRRRRERLTTKPRKSEESSNVSKQRRKRTRTSPI